MGTFDSILTEAQQKSAVAWFAILMGAMIVLAAFDLGPMAGSKMHAPRWIIALAGLFFLLCGSLLLVKNQRYGRFVAGVCVMSVTVIFAWVSIFGDARYFSTSVSILSRDAGVLAARFMFGSVAFLGFAISVNAIRKAFTSDDKE